MDEIGHLSVTPNGARLFFQLVNARYERASTVLTSNKGFEHWGEILHDAPVAEGHLGELMSVVAKRIIRPGATVLRPVHLSFRAVTSVAVVSRHE